jgi:hypothetical protein
MPVKIPILLTTMISISSTVCLFPISIDYPFSISVTSVELGPPSFVVTNSISVTIPTVLSGTIYVRTYIPAVIITSASISSLSAAVPGRSTKA